ncbi:VOC family protein [Amycolatopsis sp. WAC 01375]|uniref:VOC family protein n=1 Tax=Amycolatopsis sp. WAC 01375 TaxID=2203194 RepID=UPI001F3E6301|nr:VOC family protein [Amycolatopsis sp. WAC 01375]
MRGSISTCSSIPPLSKAEVARLEELGAWGVDRDRYPPKPDFVVLADPDGNRFCVVDLGSAPSGG